MEDYHIRNSDPRNCRLMSAAKKPLELPGRLYKFMERKWADALVSVGTYRIGTLHEYRDEEKHSHGVLDREEGAYTHREEITSANVSQITNASQTMFAPTPGVPASNMTFDNCVVEIRFG